MIVVEIVCQKCKQKYTPHSWSQISPLALSRVGQIFEGYGTVGLIYEDVLYCPDPSEVSVDWHCRCGGELKVEKYRPEGRDCNHERAVD